MPPKKTKRDGDEGDASYGSKKKAKKSSTTKKQPAAKDTELATLKYLLSDAPAKLLAAKDEKDDKLNQDATKSYRSKPGDLTPFEELVAASILAKPISHRLGIRSIAVVLNKPYSFNSPKALDLAGFDKRRQALDDAHKTADSLGSLATAVIEHFSKSPTDTSLSKLADLGSADEMRKQLNDSVKGIGKTGIDIFFRRLQAYPGFGELCPTADDKSLDAVNELDLPSDEADDLLETVKQHREALGLSSDDDVRKAFAIVLDRAQQLSLDRLVGAAKKEIKNVQ